MVLYPITKITTALGLYNLDESGHLLYICSTIRHSMVNSFFNGKKFVKFKLFVEIYF